MLIADVKRAIRLLPTSYYWKGSLLSTVCFLAAMILFGIGNTFNEHDVFDFGMVVFYSCLPALMMAQQALRIEIPFLARTSPHRKNMVTIVPAIFQFVMQMLLWGVLLVFFNLAQTEVSGQMLLWYALMYVLYGLVISITTAVSFKIGGKGVVVFYVALGVAIFVVVGLTLTPSAQIAFRAMPTVMPALINKGSVTVVVLVGVLATSAIYYLLLYALSRRMIGNIVMDRIKD